MGMQVKPKWYFSDLGRQVCIFTPYQVLKAGNFVLSPGNTVGGWQLAVDSYALCVNRYALSVKRKP